MARRRPSRSTAKASGFDFSDLIEFETKLETTARLTDTMAEDWQQEHGAKWAAEIRQNAPVWQGPKSSYANVHLRNEIRQVEPGGITMGDAFWWQFLEYGVGGQHPRSPQPFVNPAMKRIRTPARKDAAQRALDLIQRGKV